MVFSKSYRVKGIKVSGILKQKVSSLQRKYGHALDTLIALFEEDSKRISELEVENMELREQVAKMPVLMGYATIGTVEDVRLRCIKDGPTLTFSRALYMEKNKPIPPPPQEQGK
jgi:hypothetical protein